MALDGMASFHSYPDTLINPAPRLRPKVFHGRQKLIVDAFSFIFDSQLSCPP
jgi:hypothetical protein